MPELPEVEIIVRQLKTSSGLLGHPITGVRILRPSQWQPASPDTIRTHLTGKCITNIRRRAKYILFELTDNWQLVVHLRMTGKFIISESTETTDPYTRTVFNFESGVDLVYHDVRALGRLFLGKREDVSHLVAKLGIEPLSFEFSRSYLHESLAGCRLQIKDYLMNQSKIAGIGNIYASEILFRSRIHPERLTSSLTAGEIEVLHQMIRTVLRESIDQMGTTISDFRTAYNSEGNFQNFLQVYGKANQPCSQCAGLIKRIIQKQRSTFFCEMCQK
ncbi:DNA-formamidopyrimidine glycosylase [candidate division KSB1 bacterium]|nr:DNA-formamidopyrimidine glycosylase [candidate division KSB1 bacterium]